MMHWVGLSETSFFSSKRLCFDLTPFFNFDFHSRRRRKLLAKLFPNLFMIVFHNTAEDINHVRLVTYANADILLIGKTK